LKAHSLAASLLLATPLALLSQTAAPTPDNQTAPPPHMHHAWQGNRDGGMQGIRDGGWQRDDHDGGMRSHMRPARWDQYRRDGDREVWGAHREFWKNPELVTRLGLTLDQTKRLDDLSIQTRMKLIQLHASLAEQRLQLEPLLSGPSFDEARATAQMDKIADARASIEKEEAHLMLGTRAILTPDQWTKLRTPERGPEMRPHMRPDYPQGHRSGGWHNGPDSPPNPPPPPAPGQ
jgi:protein CpxP